MVTGRFITNWAMRYQRVCSGGRAADSFRCRPWMARLSTRSPRAASIAGSTTTAAMTAMATTPMPA